MQRRTSSTILVVVGAGLTAHGNGAEGIFLIGAGLFGLWHSGETSNKSCVNHMITYIRNKVEKRFPIIG